MAFKVFDNGKSADCTGFGYNPESGWPIDNLFKTFEEAQAYCRNWIGYGGAAAWTPTEPNQIVYYGWHGESGIEIREV